MGFWDSGSRPAGKVLNLFKDGQRALTNLVNQLLVDEMLIYAAKLGDLRLAFQLVEVVEPLTWDLQCPYPARTLGFWSVVLPLKPRDGHPVTRQRVAAQQ